MERELGSVPIGGVEAAGGRALPSLLAQKPVEVREMIGRDGELQLDLAGLRSAGGHSSDDNTLAGSGA